MIGLALGSPRVEAARVDQAARQAALIDLLAKDVRVATIAYRLQIAGVSLCDTPSRLAGLVVQDAQQYAPDLRPAAAVALGLGPLPVVVAVVADGAAAQAGVRAGDGIAGIGEDEVPAVAPATARAASRDRFSDVTVALERAAASGVTELHIMRDGQPNTYRFRGAMGCRSRVQVDLAHSRNAGADGQTVTISQGLVGFVTNDDELAFVIGHELAHNILGHQANAGGLERKRLSRQSEREADFVGISLMAAAGFDPTAAATFWRRMAHADPLASILPDGTHPPDRRRVEDLRRWAAAPNLPQKGTPIQLPPGWMNF